MELKVDQDKLILVRWTLISANENLLCSPVNRSQKAARSDYFKEKQLILTNFKWKSTFRFRIFQGWLNLFLWQTNLKNSIFQW